MSKSVPLLQNCLKKMDAMGINASMDQFQKVFEDLDVKTEELNGALDNVYSTTIDQSEVNNLIEEMKDAHGMEVGGNMAGTNKNAVGGQNAQQQNDVSAMQAKLDQLKHL